MRNWKKCAALLAFGGFTGSALAGITVYLDQSAFVSATGAASATGPLPDLGAVGTTAVVGTITFTSPDLAIGAMGVPGIPGDWYAPTPGNDIALNLEVLEALSATPVYAMGFQIVEPDLTMPEWGSTPKDSEFKVTLFDGPTQIDTFTFNVEDDVQAFVGVVSDVPFDSLFIVDITGDIDDEYFQEFYTSDNPPVSCYPDCDASGNLNIDDFICFQTFYAIGDAYADCDVSGNLNIDDFICFQTFYALGC
jgi:hypothetical protein